MQKNLNTGEKKWEFSWATWDRGFLLQFDLAEQKGVRHQASDLSPCRTCSSVTPRPLTNRIVNFLNICDSLEQLQSVVWTIVIRVAWSHSVSSCIDNKCTNKQCHRYSRNLQFCLLGVWGFQCSAVQCRSISTWIPFSSFLSQSFLPPILFHVLAWPSQLQWSGHSSRLLHKSELCNRVGPKVKNCPINKIDLITGSTHKKVWTKTSWFWWGGLHLKMAHAQGKIRSKYQEQKNAKWPKITFWGPICVLCIAPREVWHIFLNRFPSE